MEHREYIRIVESSDIAVLFIHGIIGTPRHFDDFVSLVPGDISVVNVLLDGHGKGVEDFSKTSMAKWKAQIDKAVETLSENHSSIFIVSHSMGCLFALEQAIKHPEKIKFLFLLAAPLKLFPKVQMYITAAKVYLGKISAEDKVANAALKACSIRHSKCFWKYIGWIPRYLELFSEIKRTRKLLPMVSVPSYVFQSQQDEMVILSACDILEQNQNIKITLLKKSRHYYYGENDYKFILSEFEKLLKEYM